MSTSGGDSRPDRATGPKQAAEQLAKIVERARQRLQPAPLPVPPEDAPAPPRPWSDPADDDEDAP